MTGCLIIVLVTEIKWLRNELFVIDSQIKQTLDYGDERYQASYDGLAFFQHIKIRYKKVKRKSNVRLYIFRLFIIYITLQGNVRVKLRVMWRNVMVMKGILIDLTCLVLISQ